MNSVFQTQHTFPAISDSALQTLRGTVSFEETRSSLLSMQNLKAPRPDGYHPLFFKSQWHVIGNSIHDFVLNCFDNPTLIQEVNNILITLIPKGDDPTQVTHFRPIALCNVIYKIVTKIITQRLRCIMPFVVAASQSSFIPERSTVDNILVL